MGNPPPRSPSGALISAADLAKGRPVPFELVPDAATLRDLATRLDVSDVRKVRFEGRLEPDGRDDWLLTAHLGATVVQSCVVTLAPVTTRIEEEVERRFLADPPPAPEGEVEMPEDDSAEPLPDIVELGAVLAEALALALPDYPRAEGAELEEAQFAAPGIAPMTDEDTKPFAGLAGLRDSLDKNEK